MKIRSSNIGKDAHFETSELMLKSQGLSDSQIRQLQKKPSGKFFEDCLLSLKENTSNTMPMDINSAFSISGLKNHVYQSKLMAQLMLARLDMIETEIYILEKWASAQSDLKIKKSSITARKSRRGSGRR